jgi:Ca2+-binding RTX toxin-like protein
MVRHVILMLTLAAIAVLVVAPAAQSRSYITCKSGQVCKGTSGSDWIIGSSGNDNIRPMGGNDYVFANGGDDEVAHSYGDDRIFGGCGSDTVRGGFDRDRIYANMPKSWTLTATSCPGANVTASDLNNLTSAQIAALDLTKAQGAADVPDGAHDLVDCAWIASRGSPTPDEGFGELKPTDTVVDCSNRDDQSNTG